MSRIAVFAALRWECAPVLRNLRRVRRETSGAFSAWRGASGADEVVVIKTGVGPAHAATAAAALDLRDTALVISTGCAGGLDPRLRAGDLVLASTVLDGETAWSTDAVVRARAVTVASTAHLRVSQGAIRCSASVLVSPADKARAAGGGAVAVEMEGGPIAAAAAATQVPFISVRAVLDSADEDLQVLTHFTNPLSGNLRPLALVQHVFSHPEAIANLLSLRRAQALTQGNLTKFFRAWFGRQRLL
ncbi:MAG: hypothetical protein ABI629_07730 [bacterium]